MTYAVENFRNKQALRAAVKERDVPVFQPGPFGPDVRDGTIYLKGPHYPEPHRWYASAPVVGGVIPKGSKVS